MGGGGVACVWSRRRGCGVARDRDRAVDDRRGRAELERGVTLEAGRVRRAGAGRKPLTETDPTLLDDLRRLVDDNARGDPERVLQQWRAAGDPVRVLTHDFPGDASGKAIPFGVYDLAENTGLVNVGMDRETAQLAVNSIRAWWQQLGHARYPDATTLQITADCGGGNGNRTRSWKTELQRLANETGLQISVSHFPPGTSKWNKIEHRLWSFVSKNWRGQPLISYAVIINLIAATTTTTGLTVYARLDERDYPKIEVTDAELAAVNLTRDEFHPEWNYTIAPNATAATQTTR